MGLRVTNAHSVGRRIDLVGQRVARGSRKIIADGARELAHLAAEFAPRKRGYLEDSIYYEKVEDGVYEVYVDDDAPAHKRDGTVGDYAERVETMDWQHRGPGTRAKGPRAGPRYMGRAFDEHGPEIRRQLTAFFKKETRR